MNFLRGFQAAFRGIIRCINHERNMRIHTVAALYVFVFSFFFEFSITGYAVLFTVFGLIMAIFAVAVAVVLFWQPEGFIRMYEYFCITMPIMWLPFVVVSALCLWYIVKGPIGMKNFFLKHKKFEEE